MPGGEQIVELVSTREIELFLPVMREVDFGDAFLLSMLHWCGIGKRRLDQAWLRQVNDLHLVWLGKRSAFIEPIYDRLRAVLSERSPGRISGNRRFALSFAL
jgi:hypothetical protein